VPVARFAAGILGARRAHQRRRARSRAGAGENSAGSFRVFWCNARGRRAAAAAIAHGLAFVYRMCLLDCAAVGGWNVIGSDLPRRHRLQLNSAIGEPPTECLRWKCIRFVIFSHSATN